MVFQMNVHFSQRVPPVMTSFLLMKLLPVFVTFLILTLFPALFILMYLNGTLIYT